VLGDNNSHKSKLNEQQLKTHSMKKTILILLVTICAAQSFAQYDSLKAQLVRDWQRAKTYTQQYLDAMPADKYGYRTHDSVRSFADQMLHLAQGNVGLVATGTGAPRIFVGQNLERSTTNKSKDSVSHYVNASYDFAIQAIKNMDAGKLLENFKAGPREFLRLTWITKGFEHQTHHRGQCTMYIRGLGIKPPAELLF
jgi:uncharacterized damage-inducible protein DinB